MSQKSGLASQIAFADEVTPGVPVTTGMVFLPLMKDDLDKTIDIMESEGIIAGREVMTSEQWALGAIQAGGSVGFELYNKNLRRLFKAMFGTESGGGPWTYTPGDLDGQALTIQEGVPAGDGTVYPFTFTGCKISEWEIAIEEGKIATLGLDIIAENAWDHRTVSDGVTTNASTAITSASAAFGPDDVGKPISGTGIPSGATIESVTSTTAAVLSTAATATGTGIAFTLGIALAAASYASGLVPLHYDQATISLAGYTGLVKSATIKGANNLAERRSTGTRVTAEPRGEDRKEYTGTVAVEFDDPTLYRRFVNGLEGALSIAIGNGTDSITITSNIRYDGSKPKVDGTGIVAQEIPFKGVADGTDGTAITAVLTTA